MEEKRNILRRNHSYIQNFLFFEHLLHKPEVPPGGARDAYSKQHMQLKIGLNILLTQDIEDGYPWINIQWNQKVLHCPMKFDYFSPEIKGIVSIVSNEIRVGNAAFNKILCQNTHYHFLVTWIQTIALQVCEEPINIKSESTKNNNAHTQNL